MKPHEALVVFVEPSRWRSLFNKGWKHTLLSFLEPFYLNQERHLEGSTNTINATWSFMWTSLPITSGQLWVQVWHTLRRSNLQPHSEVVWATYDHIPLAVWATLKGSLLTWCPLPTHFPFSSALAGSDYVLTVFETNVLVIDNKHRWVCI